MPGVRPQVERRSAPVLVWLSARPRWLLPVLAAALLIGGLSVPGPAALPLLALLALLLGWLSYLSWPALDPRSRVLRAAVLVLVAVALLQRVVGSP